MKKCVERVDEIAKIGHEKKFFVYMRQFLKLSPMHPMDAKDPTDMILMKDPTDPKERNEPTENPDNMHPIQARHATEFALTNEKMAKILRKL
jgi:hypothetical protein